ncbi:hypothetical protein [Frankia sp. EI5c]|uniref:hypothetical protein n=1 Tax=Frankia sp. EI5c TaxID=683316 RepID=UPI000FF87A4C|nr:hypothetical protein [Frankia sp. EI5c]
MTIHPILRKIVVSVLTGAVSVAVARISDASTAGAVQIGFFLAGVVFVVQALVEFGEKHERLVGDLSGEMRELRQGVDSRLERVDHAMRFMESVEELEGSIGAPERPISALLERVTTLTAPSPLVGRLALEEARAVTELLVGLSNGVADYPGEDRDWLLELTRCARSQIRAISTAAVDGGPRSFSKGFWASQLGRNYLKEQQKAVERRVTVRRIFVLPAPRAIAHPEFLQTCLVHHQHGIEVRVLSGPQAMMDDFILFDDEVSYEMSSGVDGLTTTLRSRRDHLAERSDQFARLWAEAMRPDLTDPRL